MKRLTCLVLLVLVLGVPLYGQSETDILPSLRTEISYLESCLIAIGNELNQMQLYSEQLLTRNETEQRLLKKRIEYLEQEYNRIELDKAKLEKDLILLDASEGTLTSLVKNYDEEIEILEGQVGLWRMVAIGSGVVVVAVVVWLILK